MSDEIEPLPAPPFGELMELSLTALVNAPRVFSRLEARAIPGPGACLLAALTWGAAFFAMNLVRGALANPGYLQGHAAWMLAAVGLAAMGLWAALYLLASWLVLCAGRALGGGDFARARLTAAVVLAAAPLQALCGWLPAAWALPAVVAAWIAACGLSALFKAEPWAARVVCGACAAAALGLQYGGGVLAQRYADSRRAPAPVAADAPPDGQTAELHKQFLQLQALAVEPSADELPLEPAQGAKAARSSLDLLTVPEEERAVEDDASKLRRIAALRAEGAAVEAKADRMMRDAAGLLESMGPMLNNPAILAAMTPRQRADHAEFAKLIDDTKKSMSSNTVISPREQEAKMKKIQELMTRMMGAAAPDTPPAGAKR